MRVVPLAPDEEVPRTMRPVKPVTIGAETVPLVHKKGYNKRAQPKPAIDSGPKSKANPIVKPHQGLSTIGAKPTTQSVKSLPKPSRTQTSSKSITKPALELQTEKLTGSKQLIAGEKNTHAKQVLTKPPIIFHDDETNIRESQEILIQEVKNEPSDRLSGRPSSQRGKSLAKLGLAETRPEGSGVAIGKNFSPSKHQIPKMESKRSIVPQTVEGARERGHSSIDSPLNLYRKRYPTRPRLKLNVSGKKATSPPKVRPIGSPLPAVGSSRLSKSERSVKLYSSAPREPTPDKSPGEVLSKVQGNYHSTKVVPLKDPLTRIVCETWVEEVPDINLHKSIRSAAKGVNKVSKLQSARAQRELDKMSKLTTSILDKPEASTLSKAYQSQGGQSFKADGSYKAPSLTNYQSVGAGASQRTSWEHQPLNSRPKPNPIQTSEVLKHPGSRSSSARQSRGGSPKRRNSDHKWFHPSESPGRRSGSLRAVTGGAYFGRNQVTEFSSSQALLADRIEGEVGRDRQRKLEDSPPHSRANKQANKAGSRSRALGIQTGFTAPVNIINQSGVFKVIVQRTPTAQTRPANGLL